MIIEGKERTAVNHLTWQDFNTNSIFFLRKKTPKPQKQELGIEDINCMQGPALEVPVRKKFCLRSTGICLKGTDLGPQAVKLRKHLGCKQGGKEQIYAPYLIDCRCTG